MGKVKAEGCLFHHFHGEYSSTVALAFANESEARSALSTLGSGWKVGQKNANILVWSGTSEELEILKKDLDEKFLRKNFPCGWKHCKGQCKKAPIDNINHSVDRGASFEVEIECPPEEQLTLRGT